ncbi:hypothetical protein ACFL6U_09360 [Planctomycetota bacterium]
MAKILAVAANTVKQALRMKIAIVFIILLLVLLPLLAMSSSGDGTVQGRLQAFVSYGLSLTALLLSLLTIFVTAHTTSSDIVHRQVFTVLSKPIRRWQFLLGKFLGVLYLDLSLLALFGAVIYGFVVLTPRFVGVPPQEMARLMDQFFSARSGIKPILEDVNEALVEAEYQKMAESGQLAPFFEKGIPPKTIKAQMRNIKRLAQTAAAPGRELVREFENVQALDPNDSIFIQFKYDVAVTPPDEQILGLWVVGDNRPPSTGKTLETRIWPEERSDPVRTKREFAVPADVIAKDGYLAVAFINPPVNNTAVIFPIEDGLEVMFKAGTFLSNFLRAELLILMQLVFLCAISIFASSFLSFPVAILLCLMIFTTASVNGFITESFEYLSKDIGRVYDMSIKLLVDMLPKFDKTNPTPYLVAGRLIRWSLVAKMAGVVVGLWSVLSLGLGLWIFSSREVARTN